jgi:hypothetical protein
MMTMTDLTELVKAAVIAAAIAGAFSSSIGEILKQLVRGITGGVRTVSPEVMTALTGIISAWLTAQIMVTFMDAEWLWAIVVAVPASVSPKLWHDVVDSIAMHQKYRKEGLRQYQAERLRELETRPEIHDAEGE